MQGIGFAIVGMIKRIQWAIEDRATRLVDYLRHRG